MDVECTKEGLDRNACSTQAAKRLEQKEEDNNSRVLCGAKPSRGYLMRKEILVKDIAETKEELRLVEALPSPIGRVIVSVDGRKGRAGSCPWLGVFRAGGIILTLGGSK